MTYSRPQTGQVNALQLPQPYQPLGSPGRQEVNVTGNGRFMDYTNPAQAGQNAGKDAAAIGSFLQDVVKIGAKPYMDSMEGKAQAQMGDLLQRFDVAGIYKGTNKDAINVIAGMSPRVQDLVGDAAARASSLSWMQTYQYERERSKVFTDPRATGEDRVKEDVRIRTYANNQSNFNSVPARYASPYVLGIQEGVTKLRGVSYGKMYDNLDKQNLDTLGQGLQTDLQLIDVDRRSYSGPKEGIATMARGVNAQMRERLARFLEPGTYTPEQFAGLFIKAVGDEITNRRGSDDWEAAMGLLTTAEAIAGSPVLVSDKDKRDLWAISFGENGQSVFNRLRSMRAELMPAYNQWKDKQDVKQFMPALIEAAQGNPTAMQQITANLPLLANNPEAFSSVLSLTGQANTYKNTRTKPQEDNELRIRNLLLNENRDVEKIRGDINRSDLTFEQKTRLLGETTKPPDKTLTTISTVKAYSSDELNQTAAQLFRANNATGKYAGFTDAQIKQELGRIRLDTEITVGKQVEEDVKNARASGKDVSNVEVLSMYRERLKNYQQDQLKLMRVDADPVKSPSQAVIDGVGYVQQGFVKTGGVATIAVFPPAVIQASKAAGVPQDYRSVQRFWMTQLAAAKDAKGNKLVPDPQKLIQQLVDNGRNSKGRPGGQSTSQQPANSNIPIVGFGQSTANFLGGIYRQMTGDWSTPKPTKPAAGGGGGAPKPQQTSAKPQAQQSPVANLGQQMVSGTLQALVSVIGGAPASAAEGPGGPGGRQGGTGPAAPVRNLTDQSVEVLASLWGGGRTMDQSVPPLPQVQASAPAQPISLGISNPNHPYMIAIGLNEGTRNAGGGYTSAYYGHTDPGNGKRNVGTISGQQGGTPQNADRRWMGILTQKQMQVAPILQQLGVQPNTVAYNRLMFNALDLMVQAPAAFPDFIRKLPRIIAGGATIEVIAKARADSFINPATGRLDAGGFGNSYARLFADQRSRAGSFDYKKRL